MKRIPPCVRQRLPACCGGREPAFIAAVAFAAGIIAAKLATIRLSVYLLTRLFFRDRGEVMQRFADGHVTTYRTDLAGAVSFYLDGTTASAQPVPR